MHKKEINYFILYFKSFKVDYIFLFVIDANVKIIDILIQIDFGLNKCSLITY